MQSAKLLPAGAAALQGSVSLLAAAQPVAKRFMATATAAAATPAAAEQARYIQCNVKDGVAVVKLDQPNSKVNTLNKQLMEEFEAMYDSLSNDPQVKAAVIMSAKPGTFIAGADIDMLRKAKSADEATHMAREGQRLFDKVANGKLPVVAAIHGDALGGGLECAMAAHYRIATSAPQTKLGVPEVMLGLLPGAGGTQRLPRLIPLPDALDMILTGKTIKADKAKKLGLVDQVIPAIGPGITSAEENTQRFLEQAAIAAAKDLALGKLKVNRKKPLTSVAGIQDYLMKDVSYVRNYVINKARETVAKKTKGKYPAPFKILDAVEHGLSRGIEAGLDREAKNFGQLTQTTEAKGLMSIFFAQRACKKIPERFGVLEKPVKNVCVLGAGLMGSGITNVSMGKFDVTMRDSVPEGLAKGQEHIYKTLDKKVKRKAITPFERDTQFTALHAVLDYKHFDRADLVIEAVPEVLSIKHKVIAELEKVIPQHCIIATNTSALPIAEVAKGSSRPQNVVGMHYFSPVEKMPLLEIITHEKTDKRVAAAAFDAGTRQGKTCIVVRDVPGFYVNRCLGPYNAETSALVCEGVEVKKLDQAIVGFGFPVGPMTLGDEVGLDVAGHVQSFLSQHLGDRMRGGDPQFFKDMVSAGFAGRKSGKGFYLYNGKKKTLNEEVLKLIEKYRSPTVDSSKASIEEIQMRPVARLLNEAVLCLQDDIIANPTDGDIGMVFGIGFPPFLGGPFRYIDTMGAQKLVDTMLGYQQRFGPQFTPAPLLVDMAKKGGRFHKA
eukprot:comp22929_c1_seq1/m.36316 comp22929_c1_seq1/g.36316  ORF comp22929_c1_seq1/g.36316 comp22929_c1_seq1/m.36316 type:complete len:777 (-) comp22929_c1_seq1:514-2844(-)